MTKRELQTVENYIVERMYKRIVNGDYVNESLIECSQLRTCNAKVYVYPSVILLQSYNTIVAIIDRKTRVMIDVLRLVYGYTSTSRQHITKFRQDYSGYFDVEYTWKEI